MKFVEEGSLVNSRVGEQSLFQRLTFVFIFRLSRGIFFHRVEDLY